METEKSVLNEHDLYENVYTLEEVLAQNYEEKTVFRLTVIPSISEQFMQDKIDRTITNTTFSNSRFI